MNNPDDDFQDRIQRIMNEYKREEIADKYGAHFSEGSNPDLSPEIEAQWLNYVEEFERQFENATRIPLREYVGSPSTVSLADIPDSEVEAELDRLLDLLAEHSIYVDFLNDIEIEEAYRFISEEILDEEIDDMRIPGMNLHFIYEEFHPNDEQDVKMWAGEFLYAFFMNNDEQLAVAVSGDELFDERGEPFSSAQMRQIMAAFHAKHDPISNFTAKPLTAEVEGGRATVEVALSWESSAHDPAQAVATIGRTTLRLQRSQYGGWDVTQAILPGLL